MNSSQPALASPQNSASDYASDCSSTFYLIRLSGSMCPYGAMGPYGAMYPYDATGTYGAMYPYGAIGPYGATSLYGATGTYYDLNQFSASDSASA